MEWNTIEDTSSQKKTRSFLQEYKFPLLLGVCGALLLFGGLFFPGKFQASLLQEDLFEAQEIDILPVSNPFSEEEALTDEVSLETEEGSLITFEENLLEVPLETPLETPLESSLENPFLVAEEKEEVPEINVSDISFEDITKELELSPEEQKELALIYDMFEKQTEKESVHFSAPEKETISLHTEEQPKVFRENPYTVDTPLLFTGELYEPQAQNEETFYDSAEIVEVSRELDDTVRYTGILKPGKPTTHPFGFFLELQNGKRLKLNTNRDLRSELSREITVVTKGTEESFEIVSVHTPVSSSSLPQTGNPLALSLSLMITAGVVVRKKKFFSLLS
jgi:hypothetical protein